jgi:hypothetical protein
LGSSAGESERQLLHLAGFVHGQEQENARRHFADTAHINHPLHQQRPKLGQDVRLQHLPVVFLVPHVRRREGQNRFRHVAADVRVVREVDVVEHSHEVGHDLRRKGRIRLGTQPKTAQDGRDALHGLLGCVALLVTGVQPAEQFASSHTECLLDGTPPIEARVRQAWSELESSVRTLVL